MYRKRWIEVIVMTLLVTIVLPFARIHSVSAGERQILVTVDGKAATFDVPPMVINYFTYVPLRAVFEAHGANVQWDQANRVIKATRNSQVIEYQVNSNTLNLNGHAVILAQGAVVVQNRTLVPLRFISEALGSKVSWDKDTHVASIITDMSSTSSNVTEPQQPQQPQVPEVSEVPQRERNFNLKAALTPDSRSKIVSDRFSSFYINIENYGVDNNQFYSYVKVNNYSDQDIRISFEPSDKKIILLHTKVKDPMPTANMEDCTHINTESVFDPATGKTITLPVTSEIIACENRNAAYMEQLDKWMKTNFGFWEEGSNTVNVRTYIQANDGSLRDLMIPAHTEVLLIVNAPTYDNNEIQVKGSYSVVNDPDTSIPFNLTYSIDPNMGLGTYALFYKMPMN